MTSHEFLAVRGTDESTRPLHRARRRSPSGVFIVLLSVAFVHGLATAASAAGSGIRFEVRTRAWSSFPNESRSVADTSVVVAAPGEPIDLGGRFTGWTSFDQGPPLTCGIAVGAGLVWVRYTSEVVPLVLGPFDSEPLSTDSVLVATSWRSFVTQSTDGGLELGLRVVTEDPVRSAAPESTLVVRNRIRRTRGSSPLEEAVAASPVIGVFRLLGVSPARDSLRFGDSKVPISDLRLHVLELWKGAEFIRRSDLTVQVAYGIRTDSSWALYERSTPMMRGAPVILFLRRFVKAHSQFGWTFDPFSGGYSLFDESGTLVFNSFVRGVLVDRFRREVAAAAWPSSHAYRGRVRGTVFQGDSVRPGAQMRVSVGAGGFSTATDSLGAFELVGMPIGQSWLLVEGACGSASTTIEISDEFTDSLEIHVPFSDSPCRAYRLEPADSTYLSPGDRRRIREAEFFDACRFVSDSLYPFERDTSRADWVLERLRPIRARFPGYPGFRQHEFWALASSGAQVSRLIALTDSLIAGVSEVRTDPPGRMQQVQHCLDLAEALARRRTRLATADTYLARADSIARWEPGHPEIRSSIGRVRRLVSGESIRSR